MSYVKPIFKKGDSSLTSNYRPISLTCTCCKVMESVIHDQLISYLRTHNLISNNQHGFLARKSTGTNLLNCFQDWQIAIKNKKLIDIIYLDFQKAFDSLVHNKIIAKLSSYGLRYELLSWIREFLTGRMQRVAIDGVLSNPTEVLSGVVQGSVLGPLIFILFIDDITDCMDISEVNPTSCSIFADDLKIYCSYDSIHDNSSIVHTIRNIERWSTLWQLRINPEKSILLQVGSVPPGQSQYVICNQIIQPSIHVRDLGLLYDSKLCFNEYVAEIVARAFQRVNLLLRSFISGNVLILTKAYITYVRPLLEYCTYLWSPYQNYLIDKIERVQRYFSRRVLFRTKLPYLTRLEVLKIETLEMRRIKFDLKLSYKIINGLCDLNFDEFFTFASSSVTRGHNYKLIKPLSKNNWLLNFYSSRVVSYWNSLPPDVVNASSFTIFVKKLNLVDLDRFCIVGRA